MRNLVLVVFTILPVWAAQPASAQTYDPSYPVCLHVYDLGANYFQCGYSSLTQCAISASGRAAQCVVNPYYAGLHERADSRYRHRHVY
jgi:hypothetical protein